jgi:hypothetical protein
VSVLSLLKISGHFLYTRFNAENIVMRSERLQPHGLPESSDNNEAAALRIKVTPLFLPKRL